MQKQLVLGTVLMGLAALSFSGCDRQVAAGPRADHAAALELREKLATAGGDEAAGDSAAEVSQATGWGTLRGSFKFVGTPPEPRPLDVNKDTEVCSLNGKPLLDDSLVVGPNGGLANVAIYARVKRVHDSAKPLDSDGAVEPAVFDQKNCIFLSHVLAVQVGRPLDIKNSDPVGHNTKIDPAKGVAFNQTVAGGQSISYTPSSEESFPAPIACSIHPWMKAYLLPRKDKYFAVTTDDGGFEIANLPAGEEIELQVWHERGNGPQGALALKRPDLKWTSKGRFKVKLQPDEVMNLEIEVPAEAIKSL